MPESPIFRNYYVDVLAGNYPHHCLSFASKIVPEIVHIREDWEFYLTFLRDRIILIDELVG